MEKNIAQLNQLPKRRAPLFRIAAAGVLMLTGCARMNHDNYNVPCDGSITSSSFAEDQERLTFFVDTDKDTTLTVSVVRNSDNTEFEYSSDVIGEDAGTKPEAVGSVDPTGRSDYDYFAVHGPDQVVVNVLPDSEQVTITASC